MNDPLHILCPHCHAVNRVPSAKLGGGPSCGKCHPPLFAGQPVELTEAQLARHVERDD